MPEEERIDQCAYEPPRALRLEVAAGQGACVPGTGDLDTCNTGTEATAKCDVGSSAIDWCQDPGSTAVTLCDVSGLTVGDPG